MIFNKYSEVKESNQTVIGAYKGSSSSSSSSSSSNKSVGLDREIWGQDDDGGDLNGDLTCEGNMYIVDNWDDNEDDEDDDIDGYSGAARKLEPIMPLSIADDLASKFDNDEGGNLYIKRQLVVDDKGMFKAAEYQSGYNLPADDKSSKFASTEWVNKIQTAGKIWGQTLYAKNDNNIIGNMKDVGDIMFSGSSKVIGSSTLSANRPDNMYNNGNYTSSSYNGNPYATTTNMKNIGAMSFLSQTGVTMNSVIDYNNNGHYYNNPRILWWIYNQHTLEREGHWWLGPTWANDYNKSNEGDHLNLSLYPSFDTNGMTNDEGNPTSEYFEQYEFSVGAKVKSHGFIKHNGKSTQFLMADGSVKELNDLGFATPDDIPEMPNVPTKVSQLTNDVPYAEYDKNAPVILFSGSIHANNGDSSSTNYQQWTVRPNLYSQHTGVDTLEFKYYEVNGEKKPSLVVTVKAKSGWTVKPTSVTSSVTLAAHWNPTTDFGGNRRSQGYWTTGGVYIDGNIYLQVWRTADDNNDSTTNDCIAWQAQEMNLTIYGTAYKN